MLLWWSADCYRIELLEVAFGTTDPFSINAINEYERTYAEAKRKGLRVKALLLCSPHNPLGKLQSCSRKRCTSLNHYQGRCYSDDVLKEYMKFCSRNRLHLISDEIYALSVWENPRLPDEPRFKSILSFNIEDFMDSEMVHVVWGLSKVWSPSELHLNISVWPWVGFWFNRFTNRMPNQQTQQDAPWCRRRHIVGISQYAPSRDRR